MIQSDNKTVIFILGMHRSGTSALSGALAASGARFGEDLLAPEAGVNDKGFWEHRALVRINEALLQLASRRWYHPFASEIVTRLDAASVPTALLSDARQFVSHVADHSPLFAIKDPRLCLTAGFWRPIFEHAGYRVVAVHMLRHPSEVARSLAKRDGIPANHSHALWLEYTGQAERFCQSVAAFRASYEQLLTDPQWLLQMLAESINTPLEPDPPLLRQWLQTDLRHQTSKSDAQGASELGRMALTTYEHLTAGTAEAIPAGLPSLAPMARELLSESAELFERYNLNVIALESANADLDRIGQMHRHALSVIEQREQQLADCHRTIDHIGELHSHALKVITERDQQLEKLNQQVAELREQTDLLQQLLGPIGRLRLHHLNRKQQESST